jgi:gamma-glutamyl hercynylcysteine S-oxide synthase
MAAAEPNPVSQLGRLLDNARARTLDLVDGLDESQWLGPKLAIVNPPLWEAGHVGWFEERWCLRQLPDGSLATSRLPQADALYDSSRVPHEIRWSLPLPDLPATLDYLSEVRAATTGLLRGAVDPDTAYFMTLSAMHEQMHCEALTYTRQTLGRPALLDNAPLPSSGGACDGDVEISGGFFNLGATADDGFVFDNEKWAHVVELPPFRMARTPVTCAQFAAFVDAGGYRERHWWCEQGWAWRLSAAAPAPAYWTREGGAWFRRNHDRLEALPADEPVIHVEAEWEFAAATVPGSPGIKRRYTWGVAAPSRSIANLHGTAGRCVPVDAFPGGDSAWGIRQMIGNVWEWTADWFRSYPGFVRDPYAEYSEPWFGNHKVLRGGCHATSPDLIRNTWRNFYTPDRRDVFAGFRTCAL